jgi:hypothetical protein
MFSGIFGALIGRAFFNRGGVVDQHGPGAAGEKDTITERIDRLRR